MDFLKYLNPKNWGLFEEEADGLFFLRIWIFVLVAAVLISMPVIMGIGKNQPDSILGYKIFSFILVVGTCIAFFIFFGIKIFSSAAGSFYSGSREKFDRVSSKVMYEEANNLIFVGHYTPAAKAYRDLLQEYPEELDARLLLGQVLYQKLGDSKGALKEFRSLQKIIKEKNIQYKYQETLDEIIWKIKQGNQGGK